MPVLELEWLTTDNCSGSSDNTMNLNGECWMARRLWNSTASLPRNQSMEMDIPLFGNPRCKQLVETGDRGAGLATSRRQGGMPLAHLPSQRVS